VTAEPRMEELLASIRKAIHEDIGEVPAVAYDAPAAQPVIRGSMGEQRIRAGGDTSAAAEIQELRDKISRGRNGERSHEPPPPQSRAPMFAEPLHQPGDRYRHAAAPLLRPAVIEEEIVPEPEPVAPSAWRHEDVGTQAHHRAPRDAAMLSPEAAAAAQHAFGRLADSMFSRALGERNLEDMTRDLLRQMLKQWLDEHLPALVERLVREEIERVARNGR
jgi:cell pole-organizing protein PopZ